MTSLDLPTARSDAHLGGHGTSGSTSLETTPDILLETSGGTLLAADTMVRRRDGPRRLSDHDDDDHDVDAVSYTHLTLPTNREV